MLNSVNNTQIIREIEQPQEEGQQCNISYRGTDYERTPDADSFESENKTGKTVGIIAGMLGAAALVVGGICLHKGTKALEGKDASFGEKLKEGWKELWGRGKGGKTGGKSDKPESDPKPNNDTSKPEGDPKSNSPKADGDKKPEELKTGGESEVKSNGDTKPNGGEKTDSAKPNSKPENAANVGNKGNVKHFIRDDIKWEIPEYDRKEKVGSYFTHYYKGDKRVMTEIEQDGKVAQTNIYTYDDTGKLVLKQSKGLNGYNIEYLDETEDGVRRVLYTFHKEGSVECNMIIKDYNELGQNIRHYDGNSARNNGRLHEVEIHYGADDKVCGYTEHFADGTLWEITNVNSQELYDGWKITARTGDTIKNYTGLKNIPNPDGEQSSVAKGSVIPTPNRIFKKGAGLFCG